ncbi:hypothetical protein [Roseibium algae]|uniref:Uncharacterized protein n=1 Tax=Roseibium algae TaxID=3123038 RepID=A0ABU8TSS6_9HYPH
MLDRYKPYAIATWRHYRRYSLFVQLLLIIPIICAIALTLLVGNMGLALMGTAIAIYAWLAGAIGGFVIVILGKAGLIIAKDRKKQG